MPQRLHQRIFDGTPRAKMSALIFFGGLGCLWLFSTIMVHLVTTPEERAAIAERERVTADKAAQAKKTEAERERWLCSQKAYCQSYITARQTCATAGNYDLCMSIKTGRKAVEGECTSDGNVGYGLQDQVPGFVQCFILSHT